MDWRRVLFGRPLRDREETGRKVVVWQGLSVLSPDALSSVAYGTQEILIVLAGAGTAALWFSLPISAVIVLLLAFLVFNYRQIIAAYPNGGGAYVIGRDTLGPWSGVVAGTALLIDYTLTVAVSITAGVAALVSAFPSLLPWTVPLCVLFTLVVMVINLRGIKESAAMFALPTYLFIVMVLVLAGAGLFIHLPAAKPYHAFLAPSPMALAGPLLVLRAFSSGSSALTGVEAISNGVPIFKPPPTTAGPHYFVVFRTVAGFHVFWHLAGRLPARHRAQQSSDRSTAGRCPCVWTRHLFLPLVFRDHGYSGSGGQHQLCRIPAVGQHYGAGPVDAPHVPVAWRSTGIPKRHFGSGCFCHPLNRGV